MKKKSILLVFFMLVATSVCFAGGQKDLSVSEEEQAEGWRFFMPIGFRLKRPDFFNKYDDLIWADQLDEGVDNPDEVIYNAYYYSYVYTEAMARYEKLYNDQTISDEEYYRRLYNDVEPTFKKLYGLYVLRTSLIKQPLSEITGYENNITIRKTSKYTQVFAYGPFDNSKLNAKDSEIYKEMVGQIEPLVKNMKCVDPLSPEEVMLGLKKFKFDTLDLDGNRVTSSIFKDYDVTMINIWATWCGPCRRELPELGKLYEVYKGKNCNIIGVTGDVYTDDHDALDDAIQLISNAGCKYTVLQRNDSFDKLFKGLVAWPMTIFVDKNGTIIASSKDDLIVGTRSYDEFVEAFEAALKTVK